MHARRDEAGFAEVLPALYRRADARDAALAADYGLARGLARGIAFLAVTAVLIPVHMLAMTVSARLRRVTAALWFAVCCELTGLQINVRGLPALKRPVTYVSNHVSYLDVPVLGFLLDAVFVAKSEVASWPLFGLIARLGRTVFVRRERRHSARQSHDLRARLARGDDLVLFPEGTSSNGHGVLPFRSALFEALAPAGGAARPVWVQPVSIAYVRTTNGRTLHHGLEDSYAWHGAMALAPHLFRVLCLRGAVVDITFHEPVNPRAFDDRKALSAYCHQQVAGGVRDAQLREAYRVYRRIAG